MADLAAVRTNIDENDVIYKRAVSEGLFTKVGQSINKINNDQYDSKPWFLCGGYDFASLPQTGVDGAYICARDMEIIGVSMFNLVAGSAGTLELDIKKHTASGGAGSTIFSTTPKLVYSSGNNSYLYYNFSTSTAVISAAGCTQPVLISTSLDEGDMLTCDFIQKQTAGETAGITIYLRPR